MLWLIVQVAAILWFIPPVPVRHERLTTPTPPVHNLRCATPKLSCKERRRERTRQRAADAAAAHERWEAEQQSRDGELTRALLRAFWAS